MLSHERTPPNPMHRQGPALWPSREYDHQVANLRAAVGTLIYLVEARVDDLHLSASFSPKAYELLAILEYPKPDPSLGLYPHLLLLDDGRGINLGRILRVSRQHAYAPAATDRLYEDRPLIASLLAHKRTLSRHSLHETSRRHLEAFLRPEPTQIQNANET